METVPGFIFQSVVRESQDAILVTDTQGRIIYANSAWERQTGYTLSEIQGQTPQILRSTRTPIVVFKKLWEALLAGESFATEEVTNKRKDGSEYQARLLAFPILEEGEISFYGSTCQDITSRKEADRVRNEFVSLVSHQLNTPLSVIKWYAQMLLSGRIGELNHKQSQYAQEIGLSVGRVIDLVSALLNVSRIEMGTFAITPEPLSLSGIAEGVLGELTDKIKVKNLTLTKNYEGTPNSYNADPKITWMIFQNLLSNAIKYTPDGGQVLLTVTQTDENILIKVTDTGYGIPEADHPKIFQKMFRAKNAKSMDTEGNGLGLYIVKSVVEEAGGKIWFESKERNGTSFYVILPLTGMREKSGTKVISTAAEL